MGEPRFLRRGTNPPGPTDIPLPTIVPHTLAVRACRLTPTSVVPAFRLDAARCTRVENDPSAVAVPAWLPPAAQNLADRTLGRHVNPRDAPFQACAESSPPAYRSRNRTIRSSLSEPIALEDTAVPGSGHLMETGIAPQCSSPRCST